MSDKEKEAQKKGLEEIFARVAGTTPDKHKNVLGDKWKYINAIVNAGYRLPPAGVRLEERRRIFEILKAEKIDQELLSSIWKQLFESDRLPPAGDLREAVAQIISNELHEGEPACESCYKIADQILSLLPELESQEDFPVRFRGGGLAP